MSLIDKTRKYDYKELGIALLAFLVLGLTAALAFVIVNQQNNAKTLKEVKHTNNILIDCTTPGHPCYENGRKNTAKVIIQLNTSQKRITILAVHCATIGNISVSAITKCVNRGG